MSTTDKYEQFKPKGWLPNKIDYVTLVMINMTTKEVSDEYHHWNRGGCGIPKDLKFPTCSDELKVGDMIYSFTFNEDAYKKATQDYRKSVKDGVDRFSDYLKNEYGHSDQIHQVIFTKAWEDGHSEGFCSVESEYSELSDFVDGIIAALGQEWEASWLHMVRT
jgi:hypothetical protein